MRLVASAGCERRLSREMITRPRKMRANFDSKYLPHVACIEADRRLFVEFKRADEEQTQEDTYLKGSYVVMAESRPVDDNIPSRAVKSLPPSPQPMRYAIDEDAAALARSPAKAFLFAPAKISNLSVVQGTLKLLMRLNRVGIQYPL